MLNEDSDEELNGIIDEYRTNNLNVFQSGINSTKSTNINFNNVSIDSELFGNKTAFIDRLAIAVGQKPLSEKCVETESNDESRKRKPAWTDEDDDEFLVSDVKRKSNNYNSLNYLKREDAYKNYLTTQYTRIIRQPNWASHENNKNKDDDSDDDELLRTVGFINDSANKVLIPKDLSFKRMKDLNRQTYAEGRINSIEFHPSSTAALVSGDNGIASLYTVDGARNEKLHNIHISQFSIKCAKMLPCGQKVIFGSNNRFGYIYDLTIGKAISYKLRRDRGDLSQFVISPCGSYLASAGFGGDIHLYDARAFELLRTLKQNDEVADMCFTADSSRLICTSKIFNVYVFSIRQQRVEHRFIDNGCIRGKCLALSPNQRLLATGSMEGVVNVYDFEKLMQSSLPTPEKYFLNLTTAITSLKFNHTSELLAFASSQTHNAVKLVHFPSATVYANFPGCTPRLGTIRTVAFSPKSAYFALGNNKAVPLLRLKHFSNY